VKFQFSACAPPTHSVYASKKDQKEDWLDNKLHALLGVVGEWLPTKNQATGFTHLVRTKEKQYRNLTQNVLRERALELGIELRKQVFSKQNGSNVSSDALAGIFALVSEASFRTLGMRHYDNQLHAGFIMFCGGVAEMATGEGKTLTATLAASSAALCGIPTHVISVNDYLTHRDAQEMSPIYRYIGLSVGCVNGDTPPEQRRQQYHRDITYCTNNDLVFDYLRDRINIGSDNKNSLLQTEFLFRKTPLEAQLNLRGLHFAIIDEVDSVLIDDAKTPLVISASVSEDQESDFFKQAYELAQQLQSEKDFNLIEKQKKVILTDSGKKRIEMEVRDLGALWKGKIRREELVRLALSALYYYKLNHHYAIVEGKIQIVDENTGRILPDRSWEQGLHQFIEIKEGCELTTKRETLAKLSYQRFFRRYLKVSGMTGTAKEVKVELWNIYNLRTRLIKNNRPNLRVHFPKRLVRDREQHKQALLDEIQLVHNLGRPVLIGTHTIDESIVLSREMTARGLVHQLLNATQTEQEAQIVAQAGQSGAITVATQIAGRGTDIKLSAPARDAGGLHVILSRKNEAARIDRQLAGRCARQGDPGSYREILCCQDLIVTSKVLDRIYRLILSSNLEKTRLGSMLVQFLLRYQQTGIEKQHRLMRKYVFENDQHARQLLAISGLPE